MADEDAIDSLVTPEKMANSDTCRTASDGFDVSKKTIGSMITGDNSTKVLSGESLSHSSSRIVVSRYMLPSNGSCHDMCKYGRKHAFGEKPWNVRRKSAKDSGDFLVNLELSKETRNHCSSKVKQSSKAYSSLQPKTSLDKEKCIRLKSSTDNRRHSLLGKSTIAPDAQFALRNRRSTEKKYASPEPPEIIKNVCFPSEIVEVPMEQGSSVDSNLPRDENGKSCISKKCSSALKSKATTKKMLRSFEGSDGTHVKGRKKPEYESRQTRPVIKVSVEQLLHSPVPDMVSGRSVVKTASKVSGKGDLVPSKPSLQYSPSVGKWPSCKLRKGGQLKLASSPEDQNMVRRDKTGTSTSEKVIHKTLNAISIEAAEKVIKMSDETMHSSFPVSSRNKGAGVSGGEAKVFGKKQSVKAKVPTTKENQSKTLKKGKIAVSEDAANGFLVKLKFKSGKVLDRQSDTITPRRLRFRRPGLHGNEGNKIGLRTKVFVNATMTDTALASEISSPKVVLKHQDIQEKKDSQGLLNNVIEETASKLVVTRKSKVKALVGAFETVISLQENKPSPIVSLLANK